MTETPPSTPPDSIKGQELSAGPPEPSTQIPGNTVRSMKEVQYYAACIHAFIQSRMELDKAILSLATLGLGLISTLLLRGENPPTWQLVLDIVAAVLFLLTIATILFVLAENSSYVLEEAKSAPDKNTHERSLTLASRLAISMFMASILFSFLTVLTRALSHQ